MIDIRNPQTVGMQLGYTNCIVDVTTITKQLREPIEKEIADMEFYAMSDPTELAIAKAKRDLLKELDAKVMELRKNENV